MIFRHGGEGVLRKRLPARAQPVSVVSPPALVEPASVDPTAYTKEVVVKSKKQ